MANRYFESKDHVSQYKDHRPVYSKEIYDTIVQYLSEKLPCSGCYPLAVDVGCGTGHQSTYRLLDYFEKVIGCDVSTEMIKAARQQANPSNRISFIECPAESLPMEDNSVSLVLAATALHWFDWPRFYAEVDRVLIPNGVVACMTYLKYDRKFHHPNSTAIARIMEEIFTRMREKGCNKPGNDLVAGRYTDKALQIPYSDNIRRDDLEIESVSSLRSLLNDFQTTSSRIRRMFSVEPEATQSWWDDLIRRLKLAIGTDNLDTEIRFSTKVVLLMGRKPATEGLSSSNP